MTQTYTMKTTKMEILWQNNQRRESHTPQNATQSIPESSTFDPRSILFVSATAQDPELSSREQKKHSKTSPDQILLLLSSIQQFIPPNISHPKNKKIKKARTPLSNTKSATKFLQFNNKSTNPRSMKPKRT